MKNLQIINKILIACNIAVFVVIGIFLIVDKPTPTQESLEKIYIDDAFKIKIVYFGAGNFNGIHYDKDGSPLSPQPETIPETNLQAELELTQLSVLSPQELKIENFKIIPNELNLTITPEFNIDDTSIFINAEIPPATFEIGDAIQAEFNLIGPNYKSKPIQTPVTTVEASI